MRAGGRHPDEGWIEVLRQECARTSQAAVARRLGVSPSMISQGVRGVYTGDTERLRALVEGAFLGRRVGCPVLGEVALNECLEHQARPFAATNPQRVALFRACRGGCENARGPGMGARGQKGDGG